MSKIKKNIKSQSNILKKCLILICLVIVCCTDNKMEDAHLNAYIYYVSDTYHCPITPEDKLSSREIEMYFDVKNKCNNTVFFPLVYGKDSTFYSAISLCSGDKRLYPKCLNIGYENPVVFKNSEVFRACIHIDSSDLNQLGIDADTISLTTLLHKLDISYYSSVNDQIQSKYSQCKSLFFSLSPDILVAHGVQYRGYH